MCPDHIFEIKKILSKFPQSALYLMNLVRHQCLESFSDADAKVFLQRRTGCSTDDSNGHIAELVMELGGLPLALEQAGAHIKALKCTFKQYIERFKKKRLKLLRPLRDKSI
jgi:hypothetical protein